MTRSALERYLLTLLYNSGQHVDISKGPLIAISRDYGAGARDVAPLLAKRLNLQLYDKEIIDGIIHAVEGNPNLMRRLDEAAPPGMVERLLHSFGNIPSAEEYSRALVEIVLVISRYGGVVLGRGIHLIASVPDMYRVYLWASPETCIDRLAKRQGLNHDTAASQWRRTMEERRHYLRHYFGHTQDTFSDFDLTINTENIYSLERVVDIIIAGLHASNLLNVDAPK